MSDLKDKLSIEELTTPGEESTDPDYLAWREAKVRASLKQVRDNPDSVIPARTVFEKLYNKLS